jgi:phage-related minor tail protein
VQVEELRALQKQLTERLSDLRRALERSQKESSAARGRADSVEGQDRALRSEVEALKGQLGDFKALKEEVAVVRVRLSSAVRSCARVVAS